MARRPTIPCIRCGRLLWAGSTTVPDDQRVCRACRQGDLVVPAAGQVWKRTATGLRFRVVAIEGDRAVCEVVDPPTGRSSWTVGRRRRLQVAMMRPGKGYVLVDERGAP